MNDDNAFLRLSTTSVLLRMNDLININKIKFYVQILYIKNYRKNDKMILLVGGVIEKDSIT